MNVSDTGPDAAAGCPALSVQRHWRRHYGPSGYVTAAMPHVPAQRRCGEHSKRDPITTRKEVPNARLPAGHRPGGSRGNGEKQAWEALVERYSPLIWSICRRHRLGDADARAVGYSVWRQLVRHLDEVQDPGVFARWLAAAAWRECGNVRSRDGGTAEGRGNTPVPGVNPAMRRRIAEQERLMAERHAVLREAFGRLPPCCQRLLPLLIDEPSMPDTEISARLGTPVGSSGPTPSRCLEKLRRDPAIVALTSAGTAPRKKPGWAAR